MFQKYAVSILAVLFVLLVASGAMAQDVKKDGKSGTKSATTTEVKKEVQKKAKSTAPRTMKFVSCDQAGCGFWAKSRSAKELRYIMKRHAKKYHKVALADKQVKEMVKVEGAK